MLAAVYGLRNVLTEAVSFLQLIPITIFSEGFQSTSIAFPPPNHSTRESLSPGRNGERSIYFALGRSLLSMAMSNSRRAPRSPELIMWASSIIKRETSATAEWFLLINKSIFSGVDTITSIPSKDIKAFSVGSISLTDDVFAMEIPRSFKSDDKSW